MNQIEILVNKLCPNGVPSKLLVNLCTIETGKLNANASTENGQYAFFTTAREISRIDHYRWDEEALLIAGNANVGDVKHYFGKFDAYQRTYVLTKFNKSINPRFLMYMLENDLHQYLLDKTNSAAMTYIVLSTLQNFPVLLPPLEIQSEIVRILDTFTEQEAKLEAELEARKTQYEYYRSHLLSFRDAEAVGVRRVQLGDICEYRKERSNYSTGTFLYVGVQDLLPERRGVSDDARFVSSAGHDIFMPGDVLLGNIRPYLKKVWHADVEGRTNGDVLVVTPRKEALTELDTSYLYFLLSSDDFFGYCVQTSKGAKMPRGDKQAILRYEIPVPSIETQRRIVKVLTSFETLTQDLDIGLPAEISARHQQYEYYRNKLLTFKELEVA